MSPGCITTTGFLITSILSIVSKQIVAMQNA